MKIDPATLVPKHVSEPQGMCPGVNAKAEPEAAAPPSAYFKPL
jgi:hypothetical protein